MNRLLQRLRLPPRRIVLWHSIAALPLATVVAVGGLLSFHYHRMSEETRARIDHGYQLLDGTQRLFALVEDAAIAERDYMITGDDRTLAPFHQAMQRLEPFVRQLTPLVAANAEEARRLAAIDAQVAAQLNELGTVIDARRRGRVDEVKRLATEHAASSSLAGLRAKVAALAGVERGLLHEQQAAARTHQRHLVWTGAAVAACSILLRLGIAIWMRRMRPLGEPVAEG
jgi:CHASE3 domain sensor protein